MHILQAKRMFPRGWSRFSTMAAIVASVPLYLMLCPAHADTTVSTLVVESRTGYDALRTYAGRTQVARASQLGFKHAGELAEVAVDLGDGVSQGQMLARLDTASLEAAVHQARADVTLATASLTAAEADTQLARQTEARFRSLREAGHASEQVYDEYRLTLRAAEARLRVSRANLQRARAALNSADIRLREAHIYAPYDGVIQARLLDEGSQAAPGQSVLRLVETGTVEAHVGVPDGIAHRLQEGDDYQLSWAGQTLPARLTALLEERLTKLIR